MSQHPFASQSVGFFFRTHALMSLCSTDDVVGDDTDLKRVTRKIMNKAVTLLLISKQEATVLLADLDLTFCSETIEAVSISQSRRLSKTNTDPNGSGNFVRQCMNRPAECEFFSMGQHFHAQ